MTMSRLYFGLILLFAALAPAEGDEAKPSQEDLEFFEQKIRPVLVQHCYQCHAVDAKNIQGGLVLDSRDGVLKGGDSGPAVVPKNIEESLIIGALKFEAFEMPPKGKLSAEIIADFEKWIQMGAPDPRDGTAIAASEIDFEKGRQHWAYQPIQMPERPNVKNRHWPQNNIDYFTLAKMEAAKVAPSPEGRANNEGRAAHENCLIPKPEASGAPAVEACATERRAARLGSSGGVEAPAPTIADDDGGGIMPPSKKQRVGTSPADTRLPPAGRLPLEREVPRSGGPAGQVDVRHPEGRPELGHARAAQARGRRMGVDA